jgi:methylmalonyl-CoA/ethylmalonyl-CoA epimerase
MPLLRLAHVGIAVSDLDGTSRIWEDLGLPRSAVEDVVSAGARVGFHPIGDTQLELLVGLEPGGVLNRFLEKRGPGVHHLCFEVDDLAAEMERLVALGYRFVADAPQPGAGGTLVAFLHPRDTDGVLVELNQPGSVGAH